MCRDWSDAVRWFSIGEVSKNFPKYRCPLKMEMKYSGLFESLLCSSEVNALRVPKKSECLTLKKAPGRRTLLSNNIMRVVRCRTQILKIDRHYSWVLVTFSSMSTCTRLHFQFDIQWEKNANHFEINSI
jgi:hypothetical protein